MIVLPPEPRRKPFLSCLLVLLAGLGCLPAEVPEAPGLIRLISAEVRDLEADLQRIEAILPTLPEIPPGPKGGTHGFHAASGGNGRAWVMIDLTTVRPIEAIVVIPANIVYGFGESRGYGFPLKFLVEVSDQRDFATSQVVAASKLPSPAGPVPAAIFDTKDLQGRFVKVTATEPWVMAGTNRTYFALGELLVFSRGRNIAPGKPVAASESIEGRPLWSVNYLVDGQSSLGHPVTTDRSATNGYHSVVEDSPDERKWVQLDLGTALPINEVRIFPARPIDWAATDGFGFPERFRVEASDTADFANPVTLLDHTEIPFPNPGDNPLVIPLDQMETRFVRFTATRLWSRDDGQILALAEMQIFSNGENVAEDATVTSHDTLTQGLWNLDYLTDGFDSRSRLENDELGWLRGIVRRHELTANAELLREKLVEKIGSVTSQLIWLASAAGAGLLALVGITVLRSRTLRQQEIDRLRERIAGDLHDEIGSNLGAIALLSEMGDGDDQLVEINRVARETIDSMHDIAWVIRSGHDTLEDLLTRMGEGARAMLTSLDSSLTIVPAEIPRRRISLRFKRNALLFFKEALHNLMRHAEATEAQVHIEIHRNTFSLKITDNGKGFDPNAPELLVGAGLKNMTTRARILNGTMNIESATGTGTTIQLIAKLE
jgi:signal transduction histidine kinase